jgi:polyhydroxyalkanoate synthase
MLQRETAANPERRRRALEGLRKYQEAERPPTQPPMPIVASRLGASLRDYGGTGPPVLFVPSLINPATVLDLSPERSLLRWLATRGSRVLLLDWGWPDKERSALGIGGHIEQILLPLMREIDEPTALVGYCLGGTMAVAAAQLAPARSLVTIAAPWHFSAFPKAARANLAHLWAQWRPAAAMLGVLPMEALQSAFWSLDPARTIAKFEAFADATGAEAEAFITLEDWANDGPPLARAAAQELFENLFAADLTGRCKWRVAGTVIDPEAIDAPMYHVVSTTDRIVPDASAIRSEWGCYPLAQGHVGMVVGSRAREVLWEPLAQWLLDH